MITNTVVSVMLAVILRKATQLHFFNFVIKFWQKQIRIGACIRNTKNVKYVSASNIVYSQECTAVHCRVTEFFLKKQINLCN